MVIPFDIRVTWDTVEDWLDIVAENQDWRSEDVYAACTTGNAALYMPDDDEEGLLILKVIENPFTGDKALFVWVAYSPLCDAQEKYSGDLEVIAREAGCQWIEFESKRRGFSKRGGWEAMNTMYRRKV